MYVPPCPMNTEMTKHIRSEQGCYNWTRRQANPESVYGDDDGYGDLVTMVRMSPKWQRSPLLQIFLGCVLGRGGQGILSSALSRRRQRQAGQCGAVLPRLAGVGPGHADEPQHAVLRRQRSAAPDGANLEGGWEGTGSRGAV